MNNLNVKMIKKIVIRNVASYDDKGVVFDDLQKVNFIYGGNGTGKTTISRFLAGPDKIPMKLSKTKKNVIDLGIGHFIIPPGNDKILNEINKVLEVPDKKSFAKFKDCEMIWEGRKKEVVVYNQDFKKHNLTEVMPGVFTLGGKSRSFTVDPSIQNINKYLERIGFSGFRIKKSKDNPYIYQIVRKNGTRAEESLSEGEVTIITFLYFLQLVDGIGNVGNPNGEKVVVVDDPISSLDYDTLNVVSELTNELIEKARLHESRVEQVIILTHNTTFHQSLSVRQPKDNTSYWRLFKRRGYSCAAACGSENNVMTDYEVLWSKLRDVQEQMENGDCRDVIDLPNKIRRVVETYFVDYGGYDKRKLFAGAYVKSKEDKQAIASLAKWFDEGSHSVKDNLYSGNEDMMCERYMDAFRLLFETMGQGAHYHMMMGTVTTNKQHN